MSSLALFPMPDRFTADSQVVIGEVMPGAAAALAGLLPGDEIIAVDGVRVTELGFGQAISAIRGPLDTTVLLRLRKGGKPPPVDVLVTRRKIGT